MSAAEENSVPEVSLIQGRIEEVSLGEPTVYGQMAMFPLLDKEESTIDYLTLDESIANGYAYVTEIDEGGSIPELKFKNSSEKRIFLMEGEELVGAKQNRTLNISLLAPAEKEITIPVTCVESGRWDYDSPRFKTSNRVHYSRGRREKMASVSESMNFCNRPEANQSEVWDEISSKAERMKSRSRTSAMGDIFEDHGGRLSDYVKAFTAIENQAGMLVMVGDDIVGLDLFDNKETLKKLMPKLVRSFALDAIELNTRKKYQPRIEDAEDLLKKSATANTSIHPGVGDGNNLRLQSEEVIGGALVLDYQVIHLSVFRNDDLSESRNYRPGRESRVRRASYRRSHRRREGL